VNGYLDQIPVADVPRFLGELRDHLRAEESILKEIRDTGDLSDELEKKIEGELDKFVKGFKTSEEPAAA
jgi:F-type H+-transporting ATPase subunit alpha